MGVCSLRYKAFISYSHAADGKLAPALQSALQSFAKPWYRLRSFRVFRDATNLSVTPALWPRIQDALRDSEFFLLMASPEAAASKWVDREIRTWLETRPPQNLLIMLSDGDLAWDESAGDFDPRTSTSMPEALLGVYGEEPLYLDLRRARSEGQLSLRHPAFRDAVATLAASLHDIPKEELIGEELRQHRRAMRLAWSTGCMLAFLLLAVGFAGFLAVERGERALENARRAFAASVVNTASAVSREDPALGALLLLELDGESEPLGGARAAQEIATAAIPSAVLRGHDGATVLNVAWSPDGEQVITVTTPGIFRVWSSRGKDGPLAVHEHDLGMLDPVFSLDRRYVAGRNMKHDLVVVPMGMEGEPLVLRGHGSWIRHIAFSPDGRRVASASDDMTARVWSLDGSGEPLVLRGHGEGVTAIAFDPEGERLASASADGTARVWRLNGGGETQILRGHMAAVNSIVFDSEGTRIVTGSDDGTARIWPLDGTGFPIVLRGNEAAVELVAFSPDGASVATASRDGMVRIFASDGSGRSVGLRGHKERITSLSFSPDGRRMATTSFDATARIWSLEAPAEPLILRGHDRYVLAASFSPDGAHLVTAAGDATARIWPVRGTGEPIRIQGNRAAVVHASLEPSGRELLAVQRDGTILRMSADGRTPPSLVSQPNDFADLVESAAVSLDRRLVATSSFTNHIITLVPLDGVGEAQVLNGHQDRVVSLEFDREGRRLLSASHDGTLRIWRIGSAQPPLVFRWPADPAKAAEGFHDAVFSPDGRQIVGATIEGKAILWQADGTGEPLMLEDFDGVPVTSLTFNPDGERLAMALASDIVRVGPVDGKSEPTVLRGHDSTVWHTAFSPDGEMLATASEDGTARVWRADGTGQPIVLRAHESRGGYHAQRIHSLSFGPKGERVVTGSSDGSIRVWRVGWRALLAVLRDATKLCLTADQRLQYLGDARPDAPAAHSPCK